MIIFFKIQNYVGVLTRASLIGTLAEIKKNPGNEKSSYNELIPVLPWVTQCYRVVTQQLSAQSCCFWSKWFNCNVNRRRL